MELRNLPVNLREPFAADLLTSSVVEENTNLTGNLPDYVVNAKLTQERESNLCVETERDNAEMEMENHLTVFQQTA